MKILNLIFRCIDLPTAKVWAIGYHLRKKRNFLYKAHIARFKTKKFFTNNFINIPINLKRRLR